jgi:hypothetical protein
VAFSILGDQLEMDEDDALLWRNIEEYFINTPIYMGDGNVYRKRGGVPSGSYFTQMIDSIVNYLAITYAMYTNEFEFVKMYVLGDDSMVGVNLSDECLEKVITTLVSLGLETNMSKVEITTPNQSPKFLGHRIKAGRMYRPCIESFQSMLFPAEGGAQMSPRLSWTRCASLLFDGGNQNREWQLIFVAYTTYLSDKYEVVELKEEATMKWWAEKYEMTSTQPDFLRADMVGTWAREQPFITRGDVGDVRMAKRSTSASIARMMGKASVDEIKHYPWLFKGIT